MMSGFQGKTIGVLGMARSGLAFARTAIDAGAVIVAFDDSKQALERAAAIGCRIARPIDLESIDLMVVSPGIPLVLPKPHPLIDQCRKLGIELTCDIELFAEQARSLGHPVVAVTGTNGKSTTTALIGHLMEAIGLRPIVAGNIGKAVFDTELGDSSRPVVLEVSSFQLDLCRQLAPNIAVWLNLSADHLDRHGDMAGYARAKRRIFAGQQASDLAVIGIDDEYGRALSPNARTVTFGACDKAEIRVSDGIVRWGGREIADLTSIVTLRGQHNALNAAAALAVVREFARAQSVDWQGALASFAGLAHRMEVCAACNSVTFVNDSKATNPEAAARSLGSLDNIFWIAGGRAKPGGFRALRPFMVHVKQAYLIGEAGDEIAADLADLVPCHDTHTLDRAMMQAFEAACGSQSTVLLAPACASFDQFKSFEARGDRFREMSLELCDKARAA